MRMTPGDHLHLPKSYLLETPYLQDGQEEVIVTMYQWVVGPEDHWETDPELPWSTIQWNPLPLKVMESP